MRPHKLTMKAFISYADEVTVDFDALGNTVYAIVGNTGSGKTAIFDGLMFALYGVCSGEGRTGADYEQIHCDLCKREDGFKEPMVITLEFSSGEDRYKVTRKLYWGKTNKAEKAAFDSSLSIFDEAAGKYKSVASSIHKFDNLGKNTVTQEIQKIIGLDAGQFKNIVMIAQGEFARFLNSGADERKDILGKVYRNQEHADLQARIHQAVARLTKRDEELSVIAKQKLSEFNVPDYCGLSDEDLEKLNVDHPDLFSVIGSVIAKMSERNEHLEQETRALEEAKTAKDRAMTAAKESNNLFETLDKDRDRLKALENDKDNIDALRSRLKTVDAASKVLPYESASESAASALKDAVERQKDLEEKYDKKNAEHKNLEAESKKIADKNGAEIKKLTDEISKITTILPFYGELENSRMALDAAIKDREANSKKAKKLSDELTALKAKEEEYKEILEGLENAGDPAVAAAEKELTQVEEKHKNLTDFESAVKNYQKLESEMTKAHEQWKGDSTAANAAGEEYMRLNSLFIDGYAVVLADEMRSRLETDEEIECPVCGVKHTKADISSFAHTGSEGDAVPSKDDVDAALNKRNALEAEEKKSSQVFHDLDGKCKAAKSSIISDSKKLIGTESWDDIISGDLLDKCKAECADEVKKAEATLTKAVKDRKLKTDTSTKQHELKDKIDNKETELKEAEKHMSEAEREAGVCEAKVKEQMKPLAGYPDTKADAEKNKAAAEKRAKALQTEIDTAAKEEQECGKLVSGLQGSIKSTGEEIGNLTSKAKESESLYKANLAKYGFSEETDYKAALVQDGKKLTADNIEKWIESKSDTVNAYDSQVKELKTRIATLEKQTKGKEKVDVAALKGEIKDLDDQLKPKKKELEKNKYDLNRFGEIQEKLAGIIKTRRKYELASRYLKLIDDVANSPTGEKFDAYILRDFFMAILDSATGRLEVMTGDRFSLEYDDEEKKGLGIKVLDNKTNTFRKTINFSGGQSFEASLALALGVADTVQNEENKAIQIESLFIDEGFGTQDSDKLKIVKQELTKLSGGKRQVGIISHVEEFEDNEINKVRVKEGTRGSFIKIEASK
ncbi:MAG: SMC family ATPase [Saccharofermentans sp.]|nr:SMC family ATPase [Saccharofermentans sp.]